MTGKIFRNSLLVGLSVFLLSCFLFLGMLYDHFNAQLMEQLENESWLIVQGMERLGGSYLEDISSGNRITWVDQDGEVLFDNQADIAVMENHAQREEIQQAMETGSGSAQRYSDTLAQKTLYVARRLQDGTVIRLASAQSTVFSLFVSMIEPVLFILLAALLLSLLLASRLSKQLVKPILDLDLEHPEQCDAYEELVPLLTRLKKQHDTIQKQINTLRLRQQEFTALTENMSEGFVLLDGQGRVLSYNTAVLHLLGADAPPEQANILTLERGETFVQIVEQVLGGSRSRGRMERNGRCIQILADPVLRDGKTAGAVLVLMDVSQQEQSERIRREFTANVSHELKTPLTSISGMAEIIQSGFVKPEDIPGFAGDIYRESQRLIALIEDIIHLSQLDEGGLKMEHVPVNLEQLVHEILQRLSAKARKHQITLSMQGEGFLVSGVPAVLDEMLYNLCDNAIKYNRPGGHVTVILDPKGSVTVSDTGIGIPAEDCERVFERFYRVDKSHSRQIGGTGLGLSIVKHGAALHDAALELRSRVGEGTEITLRFPL